MSRRGRWLTWGLFVFLLLVYLFAEKDIRRRSDEMLGSEGVYFLPDKKLVPLLSMGFQNIWADFALLQAQIFFFDHREFGRFEDGKRLKEMIELVLTLDPKYVVAAVFGNFALTRAWDLTGVSDANDLLLTAWKRNPDDHRLPMYMGFNYYIYGDYPREVVRWMRVALEDPEAPQNLIWIIDAAINKDPKAGLRAHMEAMCSMCEQAEEESQKKHLCSQCRLYHLLVQLNHLARVYEKRIGRRISDINDLVSTGLAKTIPPCPLGGRWFVRQDGSIDSTHNITRTLHAERE